MLIFRYTFTKFPLIFIFNNKSKVFWGFSNLFISHTCMLTCERMFCCICQCACVFAYSYLSQGWCLPSCHFTLKQPPEGRGGITTSHTRSVHTHKQETEIFHPKCCDNLGFSCVNDVSVTPQNVIDYFVFFVVFLFCKMKYRCPPTTKY